MATGLAYVSVTEAVQPALLTGSELPNMVNDWEKIPTIVVNYTHQSRTLLLHAYLENN